MELNNLLKKTAARSAKIKPTRMPPSIATEERPYTNVVSETSVAAYAVSATQKSAANQPLVSDRTPILTEDKWRTIGGQKGDKRGTIGGQLEDNWETERGTKPRTNASSSSGISINNKLTTTSELSEEWGRVDFSALASIGFLEAHVKQLANAGLLTPETLQESINAFAFDLEVNGKGKDINGSTLNYFMGILRKGPYVPPENYETPEARQMREYLEAQKRVVERQERQFQELKEIEFKKWELSLSSQGIDELAPLGRSEAVRRSQLLNHFTDHIWPEKFSEICQKLAPFSHIAEDSKPNLST